MGGVFMKFNQQPEIPQVDFPSEVSPVDQPEVEITTPHPEPSEPGAGPSNQIANPIGFNVK